MTTMRSTLLIVHPGALGDNLLALAALRGLQERFAFSRCIFVGGQEVGRLLQWCGEVDEVVPLESALWTNAVLPETYGDSHANAVLQSVSHAVCWLNDREHTIMRRLTQAGIPSIKIRSPNDVGLRQVHQEDRFIEILEDWGVQRPAWRPLRIPPLRAMPSLRYARDDEWVSNVKGRYRFYMQECAREISAASRGEKRTARSSFIEGTGIRDGTPFVAIHPGSGSPHKCLAPEIWAGLIQRVMASIPQIAVTLIGGPADSDILASLRRHLGALPVRIVDNLDIVSVAGLLAQASMFMGHDSGITHLAAAVGVPTLAVFGPTSPARWAPRGTHVRVLYSDTCTCTTWDDVRFCRHKACLSIDPDHILQHSWDLLQHSTGSGSGTEAKK